MNAVTMLAQASELGAAFFTALNKRSLASVDHLLDDESVMDFPGVDLIQGRRRVLAFIRVLLKKYPSLTFTVERAISEHEHAFIVWRNVGIKANGDPYGNRGATLFRVCNGRIVAISDYFKDTSFIN